LNTKVQKQQKSIPMFRKIACKKLNRLLMIC